MKKKPTIVISGPPGAGSTTISKAIAEKLGLDFFSPGFIQKGLAKKHKNQSEACLEVWKSKRGKSEEFHKNLDDEQKKLAKRGGVVICGKLSIHFLSDADFKVWLNVPLEVRIKRTAERDGKNVEEVAHTVEFREKIERKEWKRIYGFDYFEQKNQADFVIDSSNLTIEETVNKILEKFKKKAASY